MTCKNFHLESNNKELNTIFPKLGKKLLNSKNCLIQSRFNIIKRQAAPAAINNEFIELLGFLANVSAEYKTRYYYLKLIAWNFFQFTCKNYWIILQKL